MEIQAGAVIGAQARIGAGSRIGAQTVIADDVHIGAGARIAPRVTIEAGVRIGERVRINPGAVIGSRGFGLAMGPEGWEEVPQLGGVQIGDAVEIGANSTIDRGALEDTVIGRARVELRDHALALTGAGLWIAWSLLTVVLAGVAGLAGRTLSRGWLQPVEALTRLHAASVGLPVPPGGDLLDNPEPSAPPPPDTAVTVVNLFNHQSLAAAAAYQALERAATAAEQVAALYGGHLHATRNGVVLGWHASDAEHVWNGICGALLLARLLDDTPGGEFRIGVHLWSGADGLPAVVDA